MNGSVYAFIGDAVLTLQVRTYLVTKNLQNANTLQKRTAEFVSAKTQAKVMAQILDEKLLNDDELAIYRRGVNYKNKSMAKNVDVKSYKMATGLEALWGYWFFHNFHTRLGEMWDKFRTIVEE